MSGLFGGGNKGAGGGFNILGGGTGAPWSYGVGEFDTNAILDAVSGNTKTLENRYSQLGMGGSTPELQDEFGAGVQGQALSGQEETANVGQPALNPALQPQLNSLIGTQTGSQDAGALGSLAGSLGKLASTALPFLIPGA